MKLLSTIFLALTGTIISMLFITIFYCSFLYVGSLNIGEECSSCVNGEVFTVQDLLTPLNIYIVLGFLFIVYAFMMNAIVLSHLSQGEKKNEPY